MKKLNGLLSFALRRLLLAIPTLLIVISAVFLLVHLAPGDATTFLAGDGAIGDEYLAAIRAEYGLDDPFHIQYIKYITKVITGDLGTSFRYSAPVTELIPNQRYINAAYAMVMKHMTDSAFSKVIYDRTRIPEWTNEVGEAIGAAGGGNIADAVAVVGTGKLEDGFLELINNAVSTTKELAGATETALGNIAPNNASAILALREGSTVALEQVRGSLYRCLEEMADIWADMSCAYFPDRHIVQTGDGISEIDFKLLRGALLRAHVEISESARYSLSATQSVLDRLLDAGHKTFRE